MAAFWREWPAVLCSFSAAAAAAVLLLLLLQCCCICCCVAIFHLLASLAISTQLFPCPAPPPPRRLVVPCNLLSLLFTVR